MGDWTGVLWCRKNFNVLGITSSCFHSSRRKQWMLGLFEVCQVGLVVIMYFKSWEQQRCFDLSIKFP